MRLTALRPQPPALASWGRGQAEYTCGSMHAGIPTMSVCALIICICVQHVYVHCVYIYIYIYIYLFICIYIYIYVERERERHNMFVRQVVLDYHRGMNPGLLETRG